MEKTGTTVNNGGVSQEQLQSWKAKYRKVIEVVIEDDGERHAGYFKRPSMETMTVMTKLAKTDEIKAANVLFDGCWLGGSPLIQEEAVLKMAAIGQVNTLMEVTKVEVKNL